MLLDSLKRFIREDEGMEMVEWAIVGVVFAVAAAVFWTQLSGQVDAALNSIENTLNNPNPGSGS